MAERPWLPVVVVAIFALVVAVDVARPLWERRGPTQTGSSFDVVTIPSPSEPLAARYERPVTGDQHLVAYKGQGSVVAPDGGLRSAWFVDADAASAIDQATGLLLWRRGGCLSGGSPPACEADGVHVSAATFGAPVAFMSSPLWGRRFTEGEAYEVRVPVEADELQARWHYAGWREAVGDWFHVFNVSVQMRSGASVAPGTPLGWFSGWIGFSDNESFPSYAWIEVGEAEDRGDEGSSHWVRTGLLPGPATTAAARPLSPDVPQLVRESWWAGFPPGARSLWPSARMTEAEALDAMRADTDVGDWLSTHPLFFVERVLRPTTVSSCPSSGPALTSTVERHGAQVWLRAADGSGRLAELVWDVRRSQTGTTTEQVCVLWSMDVEPETGSYAAWSRDRRLLNLTGVPAFACSVFGWCGPVSSREFAPLVLAGPFSTPTPFAVTLRGAPPYPVFQFDLTQGRVVSVTVPVADVPRYVGPWT